MTVTLHASKSRLAAGDAKGYVMRREHKLKRATSVLYDSLLALFRIDVVDVKLVGDGVEANHLRQDPILLFLLGLDPRSHLASGRYDVASVGRDGAT